MHLQWTEKKDGTLTAVHADLAFVITPDKDKKEFEIRMYNGFINDVVSFPRKSLAIQSAKVRCEKLADIMHQVELEDINRRMQDAEKITGSQ